MPFQLFDSHEFLFAHVTFVLPIADMRSLMNYQIAGVSEIFTWEKEKKIKISKNVPAVPLPFTTMIAAVRLFAGVYEHMLLEATLLCHALATNVTHEGFLQWESN